MLSRASVVGSHTLKPTNSSVRLFSTTSRWSANSEPADHKSTTSEQQKQREAENQNTNSKKKKTLAELDEELRLAMEGHAGDGGAAGAELEGGKAVGLKRGVRDNMFRYI